MPDILIPQNNPILTLTTVAPLTRTANDLIYTKGGGTIFGNTLKNDNVVGGNQLHGGNTKMNNLEVPVFFVKDKVEITSETLMVKGPKVTRGLFKSVDNPLILDKTLKTSKTYYWDENLVSPVGIFDVVSDATANFQISGNGLTLKFGTNDINIIPVYNHQIFIQLIPITYTVPPELLSPLVSYTDGSSNLPFIQNTEGFLTHRQAPLTNSGTGINKIYSYSFSSQNRIIDLSKYIGRKVSVVLINRLYDYYQNSLNTLTFRQSEIHRSQVLGDPTIYNLSNLTPGRNKFLDYNTGYLSGLRTYFSDILNKSEYELFETPFIVYNIDNEIKDRFYTQPSDLSDYNFEFEFPNVLLNEDSTHTKLNVLTNYGVVYNEKSLGKYSGLYLKWENSTSGKRFGWILYDLRVIVLDEPELVVALSTKGRRNYTLPKIILNQNNKLANTLSDVNFNIINVTSNTIFGTIVVLNKTHNFNDGDLVVIENVNVRNTITGLLTTSTANGLRYIKRFYDDPINLTGERKDRFYIYEDSNLTQVITSNGLFLNNGVSQSGKVKGNKLKYQYFVTYRVKGAHNNTANQSEIQGFNFTNSSGGINNTTGDLTVTIPKFEKMNNGFTTTDLEIIIGKFNSTINKPYKENGFTEVVTISVNDIPSSVWTPFTNSALTFTFNKSIYDTFVSRIGNLLGPYNSLTNANGNPDFNIISNYIESFDAKNDIFIGNITSTTEIEQYRANFKVIIKSGEFNGTTNPTYQATNPLMKDKYISEIAFCDDETKEIMVYSKLCPAIKKSSNTDLILNCSLDF